MTGATTGPARAAGREAGTTLIELLIAGIILVLGIVPAGVVLAAIAAQNDEVDAAGFLLGRAQSVIEDIKALDPEAAADLYRGVTKAAVPGMEDAPESVQAAELMVTVDDATNPELIRFSVTVDWTVRGNAESLTLITDIHNP
jgi:hypothetical protein